MEQSIDDALELLTPIGKYSFIQEPVNRLLMHLARKGLKANPPFICIAHKSRPAANRST